MAEPLLTPSVSQRYRPRLVSETRIARKFVSIPKKQQSLLERDDAWAGNLGGGSHDFVNVPPEVLEDVKAAHARQHAAKAQIEVSPSQRSSPPISVRLPSREEQLPKLQSGLPPFGTAASQRSGDDSDKESSAVPIPWSSSPPRRHIINVETARPSDKGTDTQTTPSKRGSTPPPLRDPARSRFLTEFPSSAIEDGDLELEEPKPLVQQSSLIHKSVLLAVNMPEPTPPSAQEEVIPCSDKQDSSPAKSPRRPRSGLMKRLDFSKTNSPGHRGSNTSRLRSDVLGGNHADATRALPIQSPSKKSSSKATDGTVGSPTPTILPRKVESSAKIPETSPPYRGRSSPPKTPVTAEPPANVVIQESSLEEVQSKTECQVLNTQTVAHNASQSLPLSEASTPWDVYKRTYPDFGGTIGDFVRACLCIQDLQVKKALPVFLYDDFVRAFAKEYLAYIGSLDLEENSQPLTAIQWYNENVELPRYGKSVINRQNLETILTIYADEVESAALPMPTSEIAHRQPETRFDQVTQTMNMEPIAQPQSPKLSLPSPKVASVIEVVEITDDEEDDIPMHEPNSVADRSIHSISNDTKRGEEKPVPNKRVSHDDEMAPPPTLARSTPSVYAPSRKPPASPTSSVRSRKRRMDESPEQRSKRWKALLQRRKEGSVGPSSSVMSSRRF